MPLSLDLPQNVDSVIISESSAHLVIIHAQMILLNAPEPGQAGRVDDLEDAGLLVLPLDIRGVPLTWVVQQLLQEVPEQATIRAWRLPVLLLA